MDEPGQAVFLDHIGLALDEGQAVVNEALVDAVALGVDPLTRNLLLGVGHQAQIEQLGLAVVAVGIPGALETDHLVGGAGNGGFHSHLAGHEGLGHIGAGGAVGSAALQQAQLNGTDLGAGSSLVHVGQASGQTAQLGMAEAVGAGSLGLGHEGAVGIVNAFGDGNQAVLLFGVDALHIGNELVHVKVDLGDVDQVGAVALGVSQSGCGGQPAGVTAHALDDGDHAGVVDLAVAGDFHEGGSDVLGGGGEAGAVVGAGQIVVDGLGHAHDPALVADLGHVLGDLVAGIHGVVAAVVEEVAHVILLEDL